MLQADNYIWCWGKGWRGRLGTGDELNKYVPGAATEFNSGSANIQLVASWDNTYVEILVWVLDAPFFHVVVLGRILVLASSIRLVP
jgi:hypothetical protein